MQLIIVKHKKFKDVPKTEFYFEDIEDLKEALNILREENFLINMSLNIKYIDNEDLKEILNMNLNLNNEELYKLYKEKEEKI
tara:strand:- start:42932 stop:43177 length:246 start_codon:yes stop_codon:yes gene_type:complete